MTPLRDPPDPEEQAQAREALPRFYGLSDEQIARLSTIDVRLAYADGRIGNARFHAHAPDDVRWLLDLIDDMCRADARV